MRKILKWAALVIVLLLIVIQFIPVNRTNPAVTREVKWNAPETRVLAQRACFDCHSNETVRPWYDRIAPVSWLVANHIAEGRAELNFSAWDQSNADFDEIKRVVDRGEMPMGQYTLLHQSAKLSATEKAALLDGLQATLAQDPPIERPRGAGGED